MRRLIVVIGLVLVLGACTAGQKALIGAGVQGARDAKDMEALLLMQATCAMGVGAKNRVLTPIERAHVEGLCGGDEEQKATITIDTLRVLGIVR